MLWRQIKQGKMIEWLRELVKGLCIEVTSELRRDMRNQLRHSEEGYIRQKESPRKGGNETSMSEGLKGGQCGWNKVRSEECDGRWDQESGMGHAGHGRSLDFILSAAGTHWRALNRTNMNHFDSTKIPSFHTELSSMSSSCGL